jgi:MFS family permease
MFLHRFISLISKSREGVWPKVLYLSSGLFFVMLADAIISFWVPNLLQDALKSPVLMGLVVSFQSVVGFGADLIFPKMLRSATVRWFALMAIFTSGVTLLFILGTTFEPLLSLFLITMALWGIYYEFMSFARQQFVAEAIPHQEHSAVWGVLGVFLNLAYFLGPLLAAFLLAKGNFIAGGVTFLFLLIGFIITNSYGKTHQKKPEFDISSVRIWEEIKRWRVLLKHIWPIIIVSLFLGFIDSTFWTTGAVWTAKLSRESAWGSLFLPLYSLPSLFVGFIVAKWAIAKGKKRMALKFMLASGVFLALIGLHAHIAWQLITIFLFSLTISFSYPLIEGVYSDISARLGSEKKHMFGMTSSAVNISYIIWPPIAGLIALKVGERMTFSVMGILTIIVSLILLIVTPRKLKMPQTEISEWKVEDKDELVHTQIHK